VSVVPVSTAFSSLDDFGDICWANPTAKIVFAFRGHTHFCDSFAYQMFATTQKKCGICRREIDLLLPILVN